MGCLKQAYHIKRVQKILEDTPDYPVEKAAFVAAELIGASEWDAEIIIMLMSNCRVEAICFSDMVLEETQKQISSIRRI